MPMPISKNTANAIPTMYGKYFFNEASEPEQPEPVHPESPQLELLLPDLQHPELLDSDSLCDSDSSHFPVPVLQHDSELSTISNKEYLDKLEKIRNGKFILLKNIIERYY